MGEYRYIIVPHDSKTGVPLPEREMKIKYPKAYNYLKNFEKELIHRAIKPFLGNRPKTPFYRLDNSWTIYIRAL
jgi:hypothetical protein